MIRQQSNQALKQKAMKDKIYLYHMVPSDMQGTVLHPLNYFKETNPALYLAKAKKYENRKHVMEQIIPTLECLWNDFLQFTPINPVELINALIEAGGSPGEMKFYQIDPDLLDPKQTTICFYERSSEDQKCYKYFSEYDPEKLAKHTVLSQNAKDYYKDIFRKGEKPLMFAWVTHILYKDSIDTSDLPVITV